jgi:hypothetical protein
MRLSYFAPVLAVFLAVPLLLSAQTSFPRMTTVDPMTAKVGDLVTVAGENLDKGNVSEVFLNDDSTDTKVQITDQSATAIKFKVPDSVKPGRFRLVIRTPGTPPKDYIQPVRLTVQQ